MYTYKQSTGQIFGPDGGSIGNGYSGHDEGRNNPKMQNVPMVGPTPVGQYYIDKAFDQIPGKGPCIMHLWPIRNTNVFGRSGFMIHGNNAINDASEGCIILGPDIRKMIANGSDRELEVI